MRGASVAVLASGLITGLLVEGCGAPGPVAMRASTTAGIRDFSTSSGQYRVLTRFEHRRYGSHPEGGLINVGGTLYGVTNGGGNRGCPRAYCGIVYSVTTAGAKRVIYRFVGGSAGADPTARLLDVNGTLYGTIAYGGSNGCGMVFAVSATGTEKVLHTFTCETDGAVPMGGLIDVKGVLYGTTELGGTDLKTCSGGCGTVYSISTTGKKRTLHRFTLAYGAYPTAGLIAVDGMLYGTTSGGGIKTTFGRSGTVYSVTPAGASKTIYYFKGSPDGASPFAPLTNVNGTLYGTTSRGGYDNGMGTVFSVTPHGVEHVVYTFSSGGAYRLGNPVTYFEGHLYVAQPGRVGAALYRITMSGAATVLHEFTGGSDGCNPSSGLLALNGTLYGVTESGGTGEEGCPFPPGPGGTVYTWTP